MRTFRPGDHADEDLTLPASIDALRRVLRVPRVVGVVASYLLFIAAEFGTWTAILVYAYGATGPVSVGLVAVAQLLPAALLAPFLATLAERLAPDRALFLAYLAIAISLLGVAGAILLDASPLVVYGLAILQHVTLTTVRPLQAAILPGLVGTAEQLTAANSVSMVVEGIGAMLGPLVVGILLAVASAGEAFVASGIAMVGAAVLVAGVSSRREAVERAPAAAGDPDPAEVPRAPTGQPGFLDGIRALAASRGGLQLGLLVGARQVVVGALDVLIVITAIELLGMGESGAGYLNAAAGLGAIVGGASTLALAGRARIAPYLLLGATGWCVFLLSMAASPSPGGALVLLALAGVGLSVHEVTARTLLQRILPLESLTGAFGVLEGLIFGGIALGALIAGPLVALVGLTATLGVVALFMPIVAALVLPTVVRGERSAAVPYREIALLRGLSLFAPVPAPIVEQAARRLVPVAAGAGEVVIREGDVGDRFYVIAAGEVAVTKDGREIRRLGPGSGFGEIALIRAVPRTATVTATAPTELLALERDDFLLAVTRTQAALAEAHRVVDTQLAGDRRGR